MRPILLPNVGREGCKRVLVKAAKEQSKAINYLPLSIQWGNTVSTDYSIRAIQGRPRIHLNKFFVYGLKLRGTTIDANDLMVDQCHTCKLL